MEKVITLAQGAGGKEMQELIENFNFLKTTNWNNSSNDSATFDLGNGKLLVFTTDSFVVDPIFFPGGNIGDLAVCGTINDLAVMGAKPIGLSLGLVIEEGFPQTLLDKIINSIKKLSETTNVPIVTGDTKVINKGKIDKIIINTSGIGILDKDKLLTKKISTGDKIIISGGLGEHAIALLSSRFDFETKINTDSKPLINEIQEIKNLIKLAKDPTRGGIASALNEICSQNNKGMLIDEESIPIKEEVNNVTKMLGINVYELACEGRFICISSNDNSKQVLSILKKYNPEAAIIGEIIEDNKVIIQTILGKRILPVPTGRIVPRIC